MKKRGQKPNSQTYTTVLRGFASSNNPANVERALAVFDSLWNKAEKAPDIIHSNAVLTVCSRNNDLDALWEVAGRLPEYGYGSPDNRTFTIILNAIRMTTLGEIEELDGGSRNAEASEKRAATVREGKRMWLDILYQYKRGRFNIDQPLVSAMGRLLMFGGRQSDYNDVFLLLNQTMGIPLLHMPLHPPGNLTQEDNTPARNGSNELQKDPINEFLQPDTGAQSAPALTEEEEFRDLFKRVSSPSSLNDESRNEEIFNKAGKPKPTNDELTLIMEVCMSRPQSTSIAKEYWRCLTSPPYSISPDRVSIRAYLDLLCRSRSSAETLRFLREQTGNPAIDENIFAIAMVTCQRDIKNHHVFDTATELLQVLKHGSKRTPRRAIDAYVSIVRYATRSDVLEKVVSGSLRNHSRRKESIAELHKDILMKAATCLLSYSRSLANLTTTVPTTSWRQKDYAKPDENHLREIASTLSDVKSLYDRLLAPDLRPFLSEDEEGLCKNEAKYLGAFQHPAPRADHERLQDALKEAKTKTTTAASKS